jgi:hypothetical protein
MPLDFNENIPSIISLSVILKSSSEKICSSSSLLSLFKRNIIRPEQIGFCKNKRTSDHMFVLKTLIEKYTQNNPKVQ